MVDMNVITWMLRCGEIFVGRFEALVLMVGAHKGFHQARSGDVLLQDRVQPVQLLLDARKSGSILMLKKTITTEVTSSSGSMVSARLRVGVEHEDQAADHQQRRARADAQRHLEDALHGGRCRWIGAPSTARW